MYRLKIWVTANLFLFCIPSILTSLCSASSVHVTAVLSFFVTIVSLIQILFSCLPGKKKKSPSSGAFYLQDIYSFHCWRIPFMKHSLELLSPLFSNFLHLVFKTLQFDLFSVLLSLLLTKMICLLFLHISHHCIGSSSYWSLTSILSVCSPKYYLSLSLKHSF